MKVAGTQYIGDYQAGRLLTLSKASLDDAGRSIRRQITTPYFNANDNFISVYNVQLDVEPGKGDSDDAPQVMLQFSKNRGYTWGNEQWRTASVMGQYRARARWAALGGGQNVQMRWTMTDSIEWVINGATAELEVSAVE